MAVTAKQLTAPRLPALPLLALRRWLPYVGPAFLISVGYIDPGNWATDLQGGSQFGYMLLWVLLGANLVALLLQHLSAKLGIATGSSYPQVCRERLPRPLTIGLWVTAEAAAVFTDVAEFLGATLGFHLLFGLDMLPSALLTAVAVFVILGLYRFGFRAVEFAILTLVAVVGTAYVYEVGLVHPDWAGVALGTFIPRIGGSSLFIAMGILGATVMPHNLYLHSAVVLNRRKKDQQQNRYVIRASFMDTFAALNIAWLVNAAILIVAAGVFFGHGQVIDSIEQAHQTLIPVLGGAAGTVFALALLASGLASSTTATLAGQTIIEGFLKIRFALVLRRLITVVPAILVIAAGWDAFRVLVASQVALSIQLPFAIVPLVWLTSRQQVMGIHVNARWTTTLAIVVGAVILALNALLIVQMGLGGGNA